MKTLSALLGICEGNYWSSVDSPHKGPVMQSCGVFFLSQSVETAGQTAERQVN